MKQFCFCFSEKSLVVFVVSGLTEIRIKEKEIS
jgi:hypothetical protein